VPRRVSWSCGPVIGTTCVGATLSPFTPVGPALVLQGKAESFALYQQQFSVGVGVLISLITACVVGYYVGRHFIDVNNKAGVRAGTAAGSETARVVMRSTPRMHAEPTIRQLY